MLLTLLSYEINKLVNFTMPCRLIPCALMAQWNSQTLWPQAAMNGHRLLVSVCRSRDVSHARTPSMWCAACSVRHSDMCITLSTTVLRTVSSTQEPPSTSTVRWLSGCPIHPSVHVYVVIHVVQLKLHSYNYNHDTVIRSVLITLFQ